MNNCKFCSKETDNPIFCSRNCAAKHNNKIPKRKRKTIVCITCGKLLDHDRRKYCEGCNPNIMNYNLVTISDLARIRKYQKNSRIRDIARRIYRSNKLLQECKICGYSKHIEVCHIKPISEFDPTSTIGTVNSISNLVALCPNHHWELDNGIIDEKSLREDSNLQ